MRIVFLILLLASTSAYSQQGCCKYVYIAPTCADADASAFIAAVGTLSPTEEDAVCQLVIDLKDSSVWTGLDAIYPFVGGTSSSNKWNLKDPRDLDAAYRITFNGTWAFSSTGADPNGSNAYGNTYVNTSTTLPNYTRNYYLYFGENGSSSSPWNGIYNGGSGALGISFGGTGSAISVGLNSILATGANAGTRTGAFMGVVNSSSVNDAFLYHNGTLLYTGTAGSMTNNLNFYIGALNLNGTASLWSDMEFRFVSLGSTSLTTTQIRALNNVVEKFQDALGRGVQ